MRLCESSQVKKQKPGRQEEVILVVVMRAEEEQVEEVEVEVDRQRHRNNIIPPCFVICVSLTHSRAHNTHGRRQLHRLLIIPLALSMRCCCCRRRRCRLSDCACLLACLSACSCCQTTLEAEFSRSAQPHSPCLELIKARRGSVRGTAAIERRSAQPFERSSRFRPLWLAFWTNGNARRG